MHTVFFGGIAQYYEENGSLVQDNDVPFVKTIARVTRNKAGQMAEYKLPVEMPGYLGASAEFIPREGLPMFPNDVIRLDDLGTDSVFIGYIFGGIESSAANIFWINNGEESVAHNLVYKVFLTRTNTTGIHDINPQSNNGLQMQIYPNPNEGLFNILFHLRQKTKVMLSITDEKGKTLLQEEPLPVTTRSKNSLNRLKSGASISSPSPLMGRRQRRKLLSRNKAALALGIVLSELCLKASNE
jgi:hypothetical protein